MTDPHRETADPLVAEIASLDDFVAVLALETWLAKMDTLVQDEERVIAGFPADVLGIDGKNLAALASDARISDNPLDTAISVTAARALLATAAGIVSLRPHVEQAVRYPEDRKLKAGATLKIGVLATALMLVASTGFEIRSELATIRKEPLTAETINALANLVHALRGQLPGLGPASSAGTKSPRE